MSELMRQSSVFSVFFPLAHVPADEAANERNERTADYFRYPRIALWKAAAKITRPKLADGTDAAYLIRGVS